MRLLFVLPEFAPHGDGGIATGYATLLPYFVAAGHHVDVIVASHLVDAFADYETKDGIRVAYCAAKREDTDSFRSFAQFPDIQKFLSTAWAVWASVADRVHTYDAVETTDWGLLYVPWIVKPDHPPVVVHLHGSNGQIAAAEPAPGREAEAVLLQLIERETLRRADELQTSSKSNAAAWQATLRRDVKPMLLAWPCPDSRSGEKLDPLESGLVVGRVQYWKGVTVLCDAMRRLGNAAPTINWIGRDTTNLQTGISMSAYLGKEYPDVWNRSLRPLGVQSVEQKRDLQKRSAFAVAPSIWDVFNLTVVEAMALERPVICSEGAGAVELIEDGVNGFRVPANDSGALADAISRVRDASGDRRAGLGARARETVRTRLNPQRIAGERLESYRTVRRSAAGTSDSALDRALQPERNGSDRFDFLDQFALSDLTGYVWRRAIDKVLNR